MPCLSACPDGYVCDHNFCRRDNVDRSCGAGGASGGQTSSSGGTAAFGGGDHNQGGLLQSGGANFGGAVEVPVGAGGHGGHDALASAAGIGGDDGGAGGAAGNGNTGGSGGLGGAKVVPTAGSGGGPPSAKVGIKYEGLAEVPPAPCAGVEFSAAFVATSGSPPYSWSAPALPSELSFDPETALLSSTAVPARPLQVTLRISDSQGNTGERTFALEPRERCWLAYLTDGNGARHLELFDPVRRTHFDFGAQTQTEVAADFEFAPHGRLLAVRLRRSDGSYRLSVRGAPDWRELAFDSTGSVISYAWSAESDTLAVAREVNTKRQLDGLHVTNAPPRGEPGWQVAQLTPVPAEIQSELVWFADGFIAFSSTHDSWDGLSELYFSRLSGAGFAPPIKIEGIPLEPTPILNPAPGGFYAVETQGPALEYLGFTGTLLEQTPSFAFFGDAVQDPAGHFAAKLKGESLEIYDLSPGIPPNKRPITSANGCTALLAWASQTERLACVTQTSAGTDVQIFRLASDGKSLLGAAVTESSDYPVGIAKIQKRVFSNSGNWFAFTTPSELHVANTQAATPWLARRDGLLTLDTDDPAVGSIELAFSPDERFLVQHRSSQLSLHRLDVLQSSAFVLQGLDASMRSPEACQPVFAKAPSSWCGSASPPRDFAWAPDSRFLAFLTSTGALFVRDFDALSEAQVPPRFPVDGACGSDCAFVFQP